MKNTKRKKLPTADIAEFDKACRITWDGPTAAFARIGSCDVIGYVIRKEKNAFGRYSSIYHIVRVYDLTLENDTSHDRHREVTGGDIDGSKAVVVTIFQAVFRAVCKCVYQEQLKPAMPKRRTAK